MFAEYNVNLRNICVVYSDVWKMDRPCKELETHGAERPNNVHHI